ncbi:DUF1778 domain-containing protein [Algoriphagus sp. oki45]|uniref:type II toxin-antitoxin system TacA family antitoxin n=1 Tax=Algoriphagus sp. oki45 TaxID=3067294 RepID=UPI0027F2FA32|nr:DUF1778 domain-containing protein [Algoriphagus sp. oki45]
METKKSNSKSSRFDTRLSKEQKEFFEKAAQIGGYRNLTDFVVATLQEKAKEIIAENERVIASQKDAEIFFDAIMNPKSPNEELAKAAAEFESLINK